MKAGTSIDEVDVTLNRDLDDLPWYWQKEQDRPAGMGFAELNTWSRQARRRMQLAQQQGTAPSKPTKVPDQVAMGVRIQLDWLQTQPQEERKVQIIISWIQGTNQAIFESFCGMVKRNMDREFHT